MAVVQEIEPAPAGRNELADQWARFGRFATAAAIATTPLIYAFLSVANDWDVPTTLFVTLLAMAAFRGFVDVILRRLIPWPNLFGTDADRYKETDVVSRRRAWTWRRMYRFGVFLLVIVTLVWLLRGGSWAGTLTGVFSAAKSAISGGTIARYGVQVFFLFFINFAILFGPLMMMGIMQIKAFEPGDANWGVRLDDVRGQAEPKEEVRKIVTLWQSGSAFERAGGKRERGILFLGAPGTGKTMLAKAIATGFNSPFVSIPGSGFAQTFMGMDVVIVRWLVMRAKRMARKWGGQCIIFIDEIDAVGMRRQSLINQANPIQNAPRTPWSGTAHEHLFFGELGALTPTGDLIRENEAWRERLFHERAALEPAKGSAGLRRVRSVVNAVMPGMFGGGGGGQLALQQLLIAMDGLNDPPFWRRFWTNRINTILDALYVVPRRVGGRSLRLAAPKPRSEQIYFIGACNVPLQALDPALVRPGRLGRHVHFRTPTKADRKDIFDLYLEKVAHEPELKSEKRRDELARITPGYSPAMIDQLCSLALTYAHHDGRERAGWGDFLNGMENVESGTAINLEYVAHEARAIAIHEAGHAVAHHLWQTDEEPTRLSIKARADGSLGHLQMSEKEERFLKFRDELISDLVTTLGAMAAERVFYDETTQGVGGDLYYTSWRAGSMVSGWGMTTQQLRVNKKFATRREADVARRGILRRFEEIGGALINPSAVTGLDPISRKTVAQIIGQAYVYAYNTIVLNRAGVEHVANALIERRQMHGDEITAVLEDAELVMPEIDLLEERCWPTT